MVRWLLATSVMIALVLAGGCAYRRPATAVPAVPEAPPSPATASTAKLPMITASDAAEAKSSLAGVDPLDGTVSYRVLCDVVVFDAPSGALSGDKTLWSHLREDALGVAETDHLRRNGLRFGVGKAGSFTQVLQQMLNARDVSSRNGRFQFQNESAIDMMLRPEMRPKQAFVFDRQGAMSGDDYPAGVTFYWVQAWHDVEDVESVNLVLVPEIRYGKVRERYYTPTLRRAEQYRDVGRLFQEIKLTLQARRGEFVVIAPNLAIRPELVVGRALLTEVDKGQTRETVLLVRPRVVGLPNM